MHTAMDVLGLDRLGIVYPGDRSFPLTERICAIGLNALLEKGCRLSGAAAVPG